MMQSQVDGGEDFRRNFEFVIGVGGGYLEDILDNTTLTNEGEEVNELECCSKSVEDEAKVEDQIEISKVKNWGVASWGTHPSQESKKGTVHDFPHFTPPSVSLRVSQEKKQVVPKGVILVDLESNIPTLEVQVLNYDVEDVLTICVMSLAHCISTPLLGTSSCSLVDDFLLLFYGSK
ncbi:hypothetical protein Cgig2_027122 [Carnegiea gigantea]|uniref:Uncharacterized protein n=1 Tax=Carnegiea gigantea TaxID=171969 RepID=A0A9Q1JKP8_9CARY|nr:hypothetical protein Cgig2_027122 [Carnegiea gigantea]